MTNQAVLLAKYEMLAHTKRYIEQNQLDNALREIKPLLATAESQETIVVAARLYAQLQLFDRAQSLFARYLELRPEASHIRFQLGMTQFEVGESEKALATWEAVLTAQPQNPPALFYTALAYLQSKNSEKAIFCLQTILQQIPVDNLYYGKAKDLIGQLEQDPEFRNNNRTVESFSASRLADKDIYSTEH